MSYEKTIRCPVCKFQKAFCSCIERIVEMAGTGNMEEIALTLRNGKRHEECVSRQIHAEPIRATNKQVAERISEIHGE